MKIRPSILFLLFTLPFILFSCTEYITSEKVKYCHIVGITERPSNTFIPDNQFLYVTDCDFNFTSNRIHKVSDSIKLKSIKYE